MSPIVLAFVPILVAAVTGLVGYLVARRSTSGDVKETPAEMLWNAAERIRYELASELERMRKVEQELRAELRVTNERLLAAEGRLRVLEQRMPNSG